MTEISKPQSVPIEEWESYSKRLTSAREAVRKYFLDSNDGDVLKAIENESELFRGILWPKINEVFHGDTHEMGKYLAYHHLIFSTTSYENSPYLDFPGDLNVLVFFQDMAAGRLALEGTRSDAGLTREAKRKEPSQ
jgi:hypothetical protein